MIRKTNCECGRLMVPGRVRVRTTFTGIFFVLRNPDQLVGIPGCRGEAMAGSAGVDMANPGVGIWVLAGLAVTIGIPGTRWILGAGKVVRPFAVRGSVGDGREFFALCVFELIVIDWGLIGVHDQC